MTTHPSADLLDRAGLRGYVSGKSGFKVYGVMESLSVFRVSGRGEEEIC